MKKVILEWARELARTTILSHVDSIETELEKAKLSTNKAGGALRMYKITGVVSGMIPIIDYLTLNSDIVLTNQFVLDNLKKIDDTKKDILISLHNALITNINMDANHKNKGEAQIEMLAQKLILGYSRIKAITENNNKRDDDITLIKENPLLIPIFILSVYKDAIFATILKVVEETYRRE